VAAGIVVEGQGEELAILAETKPGNTRPPADIAADIQAAVLSGLGIKPYHIELVQAGSLPRTSSGKLRRSEAMKRFFAGDLGNSQASTFKLLAQIARSQFSWAKFRASRMRRGTS
jgi:acyl-CoA synthetase (AMP-forming)/AMP-acid ligase II